MRRGRGFTIIELLVVTIIFTILALIAIPAFNSIVGDSEKSLATEMLRSALRTGRAAALKSGGGDDVALVFFYEPGGRTSMVTCVRAGVFEDQRFPGAPPAQNVRREVFVPVPGVDPIQLPKNWMVRGYAPSNSIDRAWYDDGVNNRYPTAQGNWVFPETGFYRPDSDTDGDKRQTFMIRFKGSTGEVTMSPFDEVLVVAPRPSTVNRSTSRTDRWKRVDVADDLGRWVRRMVTTSQIMPAQKTRYIGNTCADTVLARPVSQLALYDARDLAGALGVRVDRTTRCLYLPGDQTDRPPTFVSGVTADDINRWIAGDTNLDGRIQSTGDAADSPRARIYVIDRRTAFVREVETMP